MSVFPAHRWSFLMAAALFASACGPASPVVLPARNDEPPKVAPEKPVEVESDPRIAAMLERVAKARGLPIKRPVRGKVLDRDTMLKRVRADVERDTPSEAFRGQGELLAALELVPPAYDFIGGAFELLGGRIAGFYDPDDGTMYLADDLGDEEAEETLAHELAHALADQSFSIGPMVDYAPGESDRLSAVHSFIEGDATSAMLDVMIGSAFNMSEDAVRLTFTASTTLSEVGAKTPRAINASLVAPYTDGFSIIQEMRRRGDWHAVDEVWRAMPQTTEQLLHVDKLLAHEPPLKVPPPALGALEKLGFRVILDDVMGEQSLRIMFEDISTRSIAREAAAGWGGDRFVVAERMEGKKRQVAMALRIRMDTADDAAEVANLFRRKYGKVCREREALGPVVWEPRGRDIALVAGPYERDGATPHAKGTCAEAEAWLAEVWQAAPNEPAAVAVP